MCIGENDRMARIKSKLQADALGGTPDDVEATFYEALRVGDLDKLMSCWADEDDIACIHPGGTRLLGIAAIRATFEAMFANGGAVPVTPDSIRRVNVVACAVHHVLERVDVLPSTGPVKAFVLATNVYHKTAQGWRMVVHHASPGSMDVAQEHSDVPKVLH
jgi:ketosteroid isomerase-like protein